MAPVPFSLPLENRVGIPKLPTNQGLIAIRTPEGKESVALRADGLPVTDAASPLKLRSRRLPIVGRTTFLAASVPVLSWLARPPICVNEAKGASFRSSAVVDADSFCRWHDRLIPRSSGSRAAFPLDQGRFAAGNLQCTCEPAGPREIRLPVIERIGGSDQHSWALPCGSCDNFEHLVQAVNQVHVARPAVRRGLRFAACVPSMRVPPDRRDLSRPLSR